MNRIRISHVLRNARRRISGCEVHGESSNSTAILSNSGGVAQNADSRQVAHASGATSQACSEDPSAQHFGAIEHGHLCRSGIIGPY
jgi:hypothetical protein